MTTLTAQQQQQLLATLQQRFNDNPQRHEGIEWAQVAVRFTPQQLWSLAQMEATAGQPDVISQTADGAFVFIDCATESPKERRSVCYDRAALEARKNHPPKTSAVDLAKAMGVQLATEEQYRALQQLGEFDLKTSSWIATPTEIRSLGGALFGDRRYNHVFVYHNGADSYYAARGFRAVLIV